jgi:hypothetical protein
LFLEQLEAKKEFLPLLSILLLQAEAEAMAVVAVAAALADTEQTSQEKRLVEAVLPNQLFQYLVVLLTL